MTPSGSTAAEDLFLAAQRMSPAEQRAYLEEACAGDEALLKEVEDMLAAAAGSESFFADLSERLGVAAFFAEPAREEATPDGNAGMQIGPYRLTRLVGAGGMGTVWQAERSDGRFEGAVAVKLLNLSAGGPVAKRFELEGRYLARLTHPSIARLLDAGVLDTGQPYLVLEYVEGAPIDRYCDDHELSIDERLRLFLDVLDGVAHAHSHLIVHRDVKPSNILVATNGTVKLLDFGVAKLLDAESDESSGLTQNFGAALTPRFAAPEQLLGGRITTATDVYSLGLLLYLLLAGKNPRSLLDLDSGAALQKLLDTEPPTLPDAVTIQGVNGGSPAQDAARRGSTIPGLQRQLRGDLDRIVRKSLAADVDHRYGTVREFADDIRRYLRHEPVTAQPDTVAYRIRKFTRRHRGGVIGACLTALVLVSATVITTWQMLEARKQRDFALKQEQIAVSVSGFSNLLFEEIGDSGEAFTLVELLERGVRALDKRREAGRPFLTATYYDLAQHFANLGQTQRSVELLDTTVAIAREEGNRDLEARALCSYAAKLRQTDPALTRAKLAEALPITRSHADTLLLTTKVSCARARAFVLELDGRDEDARQVLREAIGYFDHSSLELNNTKGALVGHLSWLHFKHGDIAASLDLNEQVLELLARDGRDGGIGFVIMSINQASLLQRTGEVLAATERRRALLDRLEALDERSAALTGLWSDYASGLTHLARHDEALAFLPTYRAQAEAGGDEGGVARIDVQLGRALGKHGDFAAAHEALDRAEAFYSRAGRASAGPLRGLALSRAAVLLDEGRLDDAGEQLDALLAASGYPDRSDGPASDFALWMAARRALALGQYEEAEKLATDAYDAAAALARQPELSATVGITLLARAEARLAGGAADAARADLETAAIALANGYGDEHPDTLRARALLRELP